MAEPEELISDAARHATVYARRLWLRHAKPADGPHTVHLSSLSSRLELLVKAIHGRHMRIRFAQAPVPPTLLKKLFDHDRAPRNTRALPGTDDDSLWLPPDSGLTDPKLAAERYRCMALQQAFRAERGTAAGAGRIHDPLVRDVYLLIEALSADFALAQQLPGMTATLQLFRGHALTLRPPLDTFGSPRRPLERLLRRLLSSDNADALPFTQCPVDSLKLAHELISQAPLTAVSENSSQLGPAPLLRDWWTGTLHGPRLAHSSGTSGQQPDDSPSSHAGQHKDRHDTRTGRLDRRPDVRQATAEEDEQDTKQAPLVMQGDEPHHLAEDPFGLQRPLDRDQEIGAEEFADMLSDLPEARLIRTPGKPMEVLLSDDPPECSGDAATSSETATKTGIFYPEWDYLAACYRSPGAQVHCLAARAGQQAWLNETLQHHARLMASIRRQFAMLKQRSETRRRQTEGDDIDIDAYVDSQASFRGGGLLSEGLYLQRRSARQDMAISLLIDISGSTDSWIAEGRRIIDVEREALLLVSLALEGLGQPYNILAFSGDGPLAVSIRDIKRFEQCNDQTVSLAISGLEPEEHTRTGAAIRHATARLMQQVAARRLLLILTDGKPHDKDHYCGRFAVEDSRQAVLEARLQGVSIFSLTIDRQAAGYMPRIFGQHHYALLPDPERLPQALLVWMKRLLCERPGS